MLLSGNFQKFLDVLANAWKL